MSNTFLCLGECLTDSYESGDRPGGSPANVAFHLANARGLTAKLCSRIGSDNRGRDLLIFFAQSGVDVSLVQVDPCAPSGMANVRPGSSGPEFELAPVSAWDFIEAGDAEFAAVRGAAGVVFGTLAQRHPVSRRAVRLLVDEAQEAEALRFADLNLRAPYYDPEIVLWTLRNADVVKINRGELRVVSGMLGASGTEDRLFVGLAREFEIPRAVLTAGAGGAWIFEKDTLTHIPAHPADLVDAVGAGDAFTAMLVRGLARGRSLVESAPQAAKLAAWVVSSTGATPGWTADLRLELGD